MKIKFCRVKKTVNTVDIGYNDDKITILISPLYPEVVPGKG